MDTNLRHNIYKYEKEEECLFQSWPEILISFDLEEDEKFLFTAINSSKEEIGYIDDGKYSYRLIAEIALIPIGFIETLKASNGRAQEVTIVQKVRSGKTGEDRYISRNLSWANIQWAVTYANSEDLFKGKLIITLDGHETKEKKRKEYLNEKFETNKVTY